jgi:isochorismate hydrolase
MARKQGGTAGSATLGFIPDRSRAVLLVLDMISDFQFPDGPAVARGARRIAPRIAELKRRCRSANLVTIYVNDCPGRWRSDSQALLADCLKPGASGADIVRRLRPDASDYFVLKPRHSAFYATPLEALLSHLDTQLLILTGISSHQCVLFTANDAHLRGMQLLIPSDCVAAPSVRDTRFALEYFRRVLGAHVVDSTKIRPSALNRPTRRIPVTEF